MRKLFGAGRRPYFEGWYFKQQRGADTVALIPSLHGQLARVGTAQIPEQRKVPLLRGRFRHRQGYAQHRVGA